MNLNNIFNEEGKLIKDNVKWYIYQKYLKQSGITNNRAIELAKDKINKIFGE